MPQSPDSGLVIACWRRVRRALVQLTGWLGRPDSATRPRGRVEAPAEHDRGRGDARTRFWAEFRAGQREAAARIARKTP